MVKSAEMIIETIIIITNIKAFMKNIVDLSYKYMSRLVNRVGLTWTPSVNPVR